MDMSIVSPFFLTHGVYSASRYKITSKLASLTYILPQTLSLYLHSNFSGRLRKNILFLQEWRFGRSRTFKVVDFGANRKRVRYMTSY